jgi:beta-glucosidase
MSNLKFPKNFMWGTAISAYQSEGNNINTDWHYFEQIERKKPDGERKIFEPCGKAIDHWNRYKSDFDLAAQIGIKVHRLSIEWSRVFPEENKIDYDALKHYKEMLLQLKKRNIKVMLNLHHFTLPMWLYEMGGYLNRKALLKNYSRYVSEVANYLGSEVDYWLTTNEPNVTPLSSFMVGAYPPFKNSIVLAIKVFKTFIMLHAAGYNIIKECYPNTRVSCSYVHTFYVPYNSFNPIDRLNAYLLNLMDYRFFRGIKTGRIFFPYGLGFKIKGLKGALDFHGLNYFNRKFIKGFRDVDKNGKDNAGDYMGDGLFYPEGLYKIIKKYYGILRLPVIITENGTPTTDESFRINYLREHIKEVHRAIQEGIPVIGYMTWSLLDNFEWQLGYQERFRFGLVHVDFKTQKRTMKESGRWFSKLIKANAV